MTQDSNGRLDEPHGRLAVAAASPAARQADPYLLERGFPPEMIAAAGWRVEELGSQRASRYGLPADAAATRVWVIPYRHRNGRVAFERIRLIDDADLERFGGGKYRQPAGRSLALYDPLGGLGVEGPLDSILVVEGEANAVALLALDLGCPVIGLPGQASLSGEMAAQLAHIPVVFVWIDRGDPGADRNAERISERLKDAGIDDVRFLADAGGLDANDALREFGIARAREIAIELIDAARPLPGGDVDELRDTPHARGWPAPLGDAAFHGLAGDVVRAIGPHSEADPAALLLQFLVAFGNAAGRGPGFRAEADHHGVNLYTVLVGETAKGRKGSSWGHIITLLRLADEAWARERVQSGVSSGEGLIWHVRDPITKPPKPGADHDAPLEIIDPGISDKRLLAVESEFASVLRVAGRDGSTASVVVRIAWDGAAMQVMTKNSPARATGAHVSIVGHITADELRRELNATDTANGFANRFLYVCVRRSKQLPEGGNLSESDLDALADQVRDALRHASIVTEMTRNPAARELWREVYGELSEGKPGMLGAVTSRAEAQVMRIACVYALLDLSASIRREHLEAGLEVWRYCEASARYVVGDALGDRVADEILHALRSTPAGLSGTELRDRFARHKSGEELERALGVLERAGLARASFERTAGRPRQRWIAI